MRLAGLMRTVLSLPPAAAYVCDPETEFASHQQSEVEEVREGFDSTVEKIGIFFSRFVFSHPQTALLLTSGQNADLPSIQILQLRSSGMTTQRTPRHVTKSQRCGTVFCAKVTSQLSVSQIHFIIKRKHRSRESGVMEAAKE